MCDSVDENDIYLKLHQMENTDSVHLGDTSHNQFISQSLLSHEDVKLEEPTMQWGYVIDTDSKIDIKFQDYEPKPATITLIKIGGIEDLNPLNYTNHMNQGMNPFSNQIIIPSNIIPEQFHSETTISKEVKDKPKKKYPPPQMQNEPIVTCQNCDASFVTKYQYQRHQCDFDATRVTLKTEIPKRYIEKPKTKYECELCHKSFMTEHNLERHRLSHEDKKPFVCQNCGKGFVLESRLNSHIENHCKLNQNETRKYYRTDLTVWECWNCKLIVAIEPIHMIHVCGNANPTFIQNQIYIPFPNPENVDRPIPIYSNPIENSDGVHYTEMKNVSEKLVFEDSSKIIQIISENYKNDQEYDQNNFDRNFEKAIIGIDSFNDSLYNKQQTLIPKVEMNKSKETVEHMFKKISVEHLYQCEFCNRTYADKTNLKEHQNTHKTDKNFECMFCTSSFDSYTSALVHWQHKCEQKLNLFCLPKIIICKICEKNFKSHELLYAHKYKLKHFTPKVFVINEYHVFAEENNLMDNGENSEPITMNIEQENEQRNYDSDESDQIDQYLKEIENKILEKSLSKEETTDVIKEADIQIEEQMVQRVLRSSSKKNKNPEETEQEKENIETVALKKRKKKNKEDEINTENIKQEPDMTIEEIPEVKAVQVPAKRGRKPKPKVSMEEMVYTCDTGYRFQCEKCSKLVTSIDELTKHRQLEHGSKFDCKDCGQVVHSSKALMIHCRAHQSLKPYVCDQCGRSYSQTSHLWQHMRFHQGIKPFACPHEGCEARYTIRPDLKDHIRKVHTRERPFRCNVCGKCFLTGSVYYQHRLIHNNDRRYGCDICGKRFFRADALNNHHRIHTNERPFPCSVCGREFRQKGDRNKHHRTQHPAHQNTFNIGLSLSA